MIGLLIIVNLLSMVICYQVAKSRKADRWYWLFVGLLLAHLPFRSFFLQARIKDERKAREGFSLSGSGGLEENICHLRATAPGR